MKVAIPLGGDVRGSRNLGGSSTSFRDPPPGVSGSAPESGTIKWDLTYPNFPGGSGTSIFLSRGSMRLITLGPAPSVSVYTSRSVASRRVKLASPSNSAIS